MDQRPTPRRTADPRYQSRAPQTRAAAPRPRTAAPAGTRPQGQRPAQPRAAQPGVNRYAAQRAARARKKMMLRRARFCGVVLLMALIIVLAVFQVRNTNQQRDLIANATPVPEATAVAAVADASTPAPAATQQASADTGSVPAPPAAATQAPPVSSGGTVVSYGETADGMRTVTIRFIGDVMCTAGQLYTSYLGNDQFDFTHEFELAAHAMGNADFTIANLETTIGKYNGKNYSGYPQFNSPDAILATLRDTGIDMFTLANNHMLDRWFDGMKNTVGWVEQYGFEHVGAYRTQEERDGVMILELNGIKIGFLAYTQSTNTMEDRGCDPAVKVYGVPYLSRADFEGDVRKLRAAGAEVIIAMPHWGAEYKTAPDDNQKYYARKLVEAGVDIIIGSHPHVVQPMGFQNGAFIMFSLGNFISDMTNSAAAGTDAGVILPITITEQNDGSFEVTNVGYIPTFCWVTGEDGKETCRVLVSGDWLSAKPEGMNDSTWARLKASYGEIVDRLGSNGTLLSE